MIDTTRALRVGNERVKFLARAEGNILVRTAAGSIWEFTPAGVRVGGFSSSRLENAPIRDTLLFYARRSAADDRVIKLQQTRPVNSLGEIKVEVEGDKIVGVSLA